MIPIGRILIDGVIFQLQDKKPGGISRVWKNHLLFLAKSHLNSSIVLLDRGGTAPPIPGMKSKLIDRFDPLVFEADSLYLQEIMEQERGDLLISTYFTYPENSPSMIMLHDMTPEVLGLDMNHPEWLSKTQAIEKAVAYLAVSKSTKKDFRKLYPRHKNKKVTVVHNAASDLFKPQSIKDIQQFKREYNIEKPYYLLVGRRDGYKNAAVFFRAFSHLKNKCDYEIFCTGGQARLEKILQSSLDDDTRCQVQHLSDHGLAVAYSGALCLVYPSLYEGFGLPILEAHQSGCPVITYRNSSLPEVAGKAAIFPKMHDVSSLTKALKKIQQTDFRRKLISEGYENALRFSWKESSQQLLKAIDDVFQILPGLPANPSTPDYAGIRFAYSLSKIPESKLLSETLTRSTKLIAAQKLSLDFTALIPVEQDIKDLIDPEILKRLKTASSHPMSDGLLHYWLGLAYLASGKEQEALTCFIDAIQKDINCARVNYLAAELAHSLKHWKLAENLWGSLSSTFPHYEPARERLEQVRRRKPLARQARVSRKPSLSSEYILETILNSPDISKAVNEFHDQLTPELVDLVMSNAEQAGLDGQQALAIGLISLADLLKSKIQPSHQAA